MAGLVDSIQRVRVAIDKQLDARLTNFHYPITATFALIVLSTFAAAALAGFTGLTVVAATGLPLAAADAIVLPVFKIASVVATVALFLMVPSFAFESGKLLYRRYHQQRV